MSSSSFPKQHPYLIGAFAALGMPIVHAFQNPQYIIFVPWEYLFWLVVIEGIMWVVLKIRGTQKNETPTSTASTQVVTQNLETSQKTKPHTTFNNVIAIFGAAVSISIMLVVMVILGRLIDQRNQTNLTGTPTPSVQDTVQQDLQTESDIKNQSKKVSVTDLAKLSQQNMNGYFTVTGKVLDIKQGSDPVDGTMIIYDSYQVAI